MLTDRETMMRTREPSTAYSRGPDPLTVALVVVAAVVVALIIVMWPGA